METFGFVDGFAQQNIQETMLKKVEKRINSLLRTTLLREKRRGYTLVYFISV